MLSLICMLTAVAAAPEQSASINIAVINVANASEQYKKTTQLEQQFDQMRTAFNEARLAKEEEIKRLNQALETQFKPGSADYKARQRELFVLQAEYETFMKDEGEKLQTSVTKSLRTIYDDITQMVGKVAKERNLDLVLPIEPMPEALPEDPQQLRQQIMFQKVIYASDRIDVTAEVVSRLNQEFEKQGKASESEADPNGTAKEAPKLASVDNS